ncbi:MAG: DUF1326 domain-containing protein [Gemmatimonadetes bacterium]|nr:DUF1326 domain-containing protein [Gemmatimonadota bacterium]
MMKTGFALMAAIVLAASPALAGSPSIAGDYVEVRSNHILGGGCTYSAEAGGDANQAVVAWHIRDGALADLSVVAVILGKGNLQLGHHARETVLLIDSRATPGQRQELKRAFTARYGELFGTVKTVKPTDISFRHDGGDAYAVTVDGQVRVATRTMLATDHEPNCDRMVWYDPFTKDASAALVQTAAHAYSGSDLIATWSIPNKRSAYVGTFAFTP